MFHVLNRGVGRRRLFHKDEDYAGFERTVELALAAVPVRLLAYCLMPNHWHLLLWPRADSKAFRRRKMRTILRWPVTSSAMPFEPS